uniref:Uncharacterized protein n=1 Tax=Anguilla anguilla TaxID=7936 RepID=A0A0E9Q558_ANGAN
MGRYKQLNRWSVSVTASDLSLIQNTAEIDR